MADELMEELRAEQLAHKKDLAERYLRDGDEEALDELILLSDPDEIPRERSVRVTSEGLDDSREIQPLRTPEQRYRAYAERLLGLPGSAVPEHDQVGSRSDPYRSHWLTGRPIHKRSPGVRVETTGAEDIIQASESTSRKGGPGQTIEEAKEGHRADIQSHDFGMNRYVTPEDFIVRLGVGREQATIISNIANEALGRKRAGQESLRAIEEEFPEGE